MANQKIARFYVISWIRGCESLRLTKMNRRKRSVTIYVRNKQRYNPASKLYNFINVRVENFAGTKIGDIKEVCMQKVCKFYTGSWIVYKQEAHVTEFIPLMLYRRPDDNREIMRKLMTYIWITRDWLMIGNTPCSVSTIFFLMCELLNHRINLATHVYMSQSKKFSVINFVNSYS